MAKINVHCDTCKKMHTVDRTEEIPDEVVALKCNWCPGCEDQAQDYYMEDYLTYEPFHPDLIPPNQLNLF